jgi:UrcA family protein
MRFRRLIGTALFSAIYFGFTSLPAAANGIESLPTYTVKVGDLDITNQQGAVALYRRIERAAREVCGPQESDPTFRLCLDRTIADAVGKINTPALVAVYHAKTGKTVPLQVASLQSR